MNLPQKDKNKNLGSNLLQSRFNFAFADPIFFVVEDFNCVLGFTFWLQKISIVFWVSLFGCRRFQLCCGFHFVLQKISIVLWVSFCVAEDFNCVVGFSFVLQISIVLEVSFLLQKISIVLWVSLCVADIQLCCRFFTLCCRRFQLCCGFHFVLQISIVL